MASAGEEGGIAGSHTSNYHVITEHTLWHRYAISVVRIFTNFISVRREF